MPEHTTPGSPALGPLVGFVGALRRAGLPVPSDASVAYTEAVAAVGVERPEGVYWAGRATLVRRPEDVAGYDRVFAAYFGQLPIALVVQPVEPVELVLDTGAPGAGDDEQSDGAGPSRAMRWSRQEILRHKDLAACTPDELAEAQQLMADLRVHAALRRSRRRRHQPPGRSRGRPDLRRSLRRAKRTDGEVLALATTRPGERPRRLVLLLDVSGSMEPYARSLARFAHAAVAARRHGQVEVFALGTRTTRITRELATHDPDEALTRAAAAVDDWAGGTRLGDGLRRFNDRWGTRGLARGAVVVILSDGWDRGDPDVLGAETARLRRVAYRLVWVNPLQALPGYAPLAQGMAAALPHVDTMVEGHSVASLEALARLVAR